MRTIIPAVVLAAAAAAAQTTIRTASLQTSSVLPTTLGSLESFSYTATTGETFTTEGSITVIPISGFSSTSTLPLSRPTLVPPPLSATSLSGSGTESTTMTSPGSSTASMSGTGTTSATGTASTTGTASGTNSAAGTSTTGGGSSGANMLYVPKMLGAVAVGCVGALLVLA